MERNARFHQWINDGWVTLTLRPGQTLRWYRCTSHDEGWSSEYEEWTHEGEFVSRSFTSDGRDCDGRLTHNVDLVCPLDHLASYETPDGTLIPDWREERHEVYDQYARMAGY